jgi:4-hydroxy-tetrahydrodipicolinate reductase
MIKIGIIGITGKMGAALVATTLENPSISLLGITRSPLSFQHLSIKAFTLNTAPLDTLDLLIDVSHAHSLEKHLQAALLYKLPIVIGTTSHEEKAFHQMQQASTIIPVLYASNFSIGIHLIKSFITTHLPLLEESFIDILETHHTEKKDMPSGTALDLASLFEKKHLSIHPQAQRSKEDLVIHSRRLPAHPGEHRLHFTFHHETLSLEHHVKDRKVYAEGALLAAKFLMQQQPGFYSFSDVFSV